MIQYLDYHIFNQEKSKIKQNAGERITENIMGENFPDIKEDTNPYYACMREKFLSKAK
jgi:hypothetical protein